MAIHETKHSDGVRYFVLDFRDQHGRRIRERLAAGTTKAEAKDAYIDRLSTVSKGTYRHATLDAALPSEAFSDFVEKVFLVERPKAYTRWSVTGLKTFFKDDPLGTIDAGRVLEYQNWRAANGGGPATIRYELTTLRAVLRRGKIARMVTAEQVADVYQVKLPAKPRPEGHYLKADDRAALLKACERHPWLKRIVEWAVLTGMDRGEIVALDWSQIDLDAGVVNAPRGKTGVPRTVPLTPRLKTILGATGKVRSITTGPVFRGSEGEAVNLAGLKTQLYKVYRRAGLEPRQPFKVFRHTFRTLGRLAGVDPGVMAALMGHRSSSMTEGYGAVPLAALRSAALAIDAAYGGRDLDANRMETAG